MKILVEEKKTGRFLTELGSWTIDARQAKDFKRTTSAIEHCLQENLQEVCVLMMFGMDRGLDVRLEPFSLQRATNVAAR